MWEFSVSMHSQKSAMAKFIYKVLKPIVSSAGGVITTFEECEQISVLISAEDFEKPHLEYKIADVLTKAICFYLKEDFLNKHLKFPKKSAIEIHTFKKALVNFDRETDRFLVNKNINLDKNIIIESFFYFKLKSLKEKWQELVKIANDNSTYFLSADSFMELLRFLVENIEFSFDEVNVIYKNEEILLLNTDFEKIESLEKSFCNDMELVSYLLELSPRKINWYAISHNAFIEKVFEKRIYFIQSSENFKNVLDKRIRLM